MPESVSKENRPSAHSRDEMIQEAVQCFVRGQYSKVCNVGKKAELLWPKKVPLPIILLVRWAYRSEPRLIQPELPRESDIDDVRMPLCLKYRFSHFPLQTNCSLMLAIDVGEGCQ